MATYLAYPKKSDTPSRNSRKASRRKVFEHNKTVAVKERKARRLARKQAEEEAAASEE